MIYEYTDISGKNIFSLRILKHGLGTEKGSKNSSYYLTYSKRTLPSARVGLSNRNANNKCLTKRNICWAALLAGGIGLLQAVAAPISSCSFLFADHTACLLAIALTLHIVPGQEERSSHTPAISLWPDVSHMATRSAWEPGKCNPLEALLLRDKRRHGEKTNSL